MHRIRSKAHVSTHGLRKPGSHSILPLSNVSTRNDDPNAEHGAANVASASRKSSLKNPGVGTAQTQNTSEVPLPAAKEANGNSTPPVEEIEEKPNIFIRFIRATKDVLFSSVFNLLLVFVPVGIALEFSGANPTLVFAMNAVAIIPLAGLLAHATESVAASLGDTVGALLNVTFGNAVELIIFIIALVKNEIRIVQASLVGSILSNLLLILGGCFVLGGLRYREQIYNATVTQMSACLLSLSVTSLLLPTGFHWSFKDNDLANEKVLQLSRGCSIILLLIYILYLVFQLKSHAYLYASTPQHIIDEESHPGVLANIMNSSSSSSSSDSSSDTDSSSGSHTTAKRLKKALRRRRRTSSSSSKDTNSVPSATNTPSMGTFTDALTTHSPTDMNGGNLNAVTSGDEADDDGERKKRRHKSKRNKKTRSNDQESGRPGSSSSQEKKAKKSKKSRKNKNNDGAGENGATEPAAHATKVAFSPEEEQIPPADHHNTPANRPFAKSLSVRPTMPKLLTSTVFSSHNPTGGLPTVSSTRPGAPYGLRRTTSLPDRLNRPSSNLSATNQQVPRTVVFETDLSDDEEEPEKQMSRLGAVVLLLISTGLVALCAESLVSSIGYMVDHTNVSQAFIGLIILPIVGNAAEHVTAMTVAAKNKMDLAIGVAVGSSIQIALFVTPVVVLLGWMMEKPMSLYFSLFETLSLFVSAFIINFLILDGRSNYLEGALLIAAYVIIAVAAYFYPDQQDQSDVGGGAADALALATRGIATVVGKAFVA